MSPQPDPLPTNNTPAKTVARFVAAYERKDGEAWRGLFTGDFQFYFSNATDPTLATQYASGWFAEDESTSAANLFVGFTDGLGNVVPGASTIDLNLSQATPLGDPTSPDPTKYTFLLTVVNLTVVLHRAPYETEPTTYLINNNVHRLFFVRGDAANGLDDSQPADSLHWYIYRWMDETGYVPAPDRRTAATAPATWGRLKGQYR